MCIACHNTLINRKEMPDISYHNDLQFDDVPPPVKSLTELEEQLICKNILFMKIFPARVSRMDVIRDYVINVPLDDIDVQKTITSLPRTPDEAFMVSVQLKRMLKLKMCTILRMCGPPC